MLLRVLLIALVAFGVWQFLLRDSSVEMGPGVHAPEAPLQVPIKQADSFELKGYRITPLAEFRIKAKILGRENYSRDRESDLSPIDLALGWGRMSDEAVLEAIHISQSGRWYRWRTDNFPIPRREIETHSANMHMIPADETVADTLDQAREGQIIELEGYLVRAEGEGAWRWSSSMRRTDTGANSCEVVYVKRARLPG